MDKKKICFTMLYMLQVVLNWLKLSFLIPNARFRIPPYHLL